LDTLIEVFPADSSKLHALLLAECQAHAATKADLGSQLRTALLERDAAKAKLQALLQRYFGRSCEKLDPRQLRMA